MENYYNRLGVASNASLHEIKAAYKKLAFRFHPDRNQSNPEAEEIFKKINTAYHVLSDPEKREKYDLLLSYGTYQPPQTTYYQPESFTRYRPRPMRRERTYKFDRDYFKYQAIAILVVLFISMLVISVTEFNKYLKEREVAIVKEENDRILANAYSKYNTGDFQGALKMVQQLAKKYPADYTLYIERDKMVKTLFEKAKRQYSARDYENAIFNFLIVTEFQHPMQLQTWEYLAKSFMATKNYENAAEAYEYIYLRDKYNLNLILQIANLYHYNLDDLDKALEFYKKGKILFKERQSHLYGDAFELLMDPERTPDIYYDLFFHRAKANYKAGNYQTAVTDCNWATFLRPKHTDPYLLRARSYLELEKFRRACKDYTIALSKGAEINENISFCSN